jgi:hypothetical protein
MNLNHLSDDELLRYLDKYSEDPIMRRVVDILLYKQDSIISDLVAAGMDPQDCTFSENSFNYYNPGEYITHLTNEIDSIETDLENAQYDLREAEIKIKRQEARTVSALIAELNEQLNQMASERDQAWRQRDRAIESENLTKDKMKVWTAISTDVSK